MAKLEEISTFNLDGKTYAIDKLDTNAKELLKVYLQTEDDIIKLRISLVQMQHALSSMGNMFKEMIKDLEPVSAEELAARQAAEALAAVKAQPTDKPAPKRKPAVKRASAK